MLPSNYVFVRKYFPFIASFCVYIYLNIYLVKNIKNCRCKSLPSDDQFRCCSRSLTSFLKRIHVVLELQISYVPDLHYFRSYPFRSLTFQISHPKISHACKSYFFDEAISTLHRSLFQIFVTFEIFAILPCFFRSLFRFSFDLNCLSQHLSLS